MLSSLPLSSGILSKIENESFYGYEWIGGGDTLPEDPGELTQPQLFFYTVDGQYYAAESLGTWEPISVTDFRYLTNEDLTGSSVRIQWVYDGSAFYRIYVRNLSDEIVQVHQVETDITGLPQFTLPYLSHGIGSISVVACDIESGFVLEKHEIPSYAQQIIFTPGEPTVSLKLIGTDIVVRKRY